MSGSGYRLLAAGAFPLLSHGQIDQRFADLVGGLHLAVADSIDRGLTGTHSSADGLLSEPRSAEAVDGC